jgi:Protein of unknown function (DUF2849)
MAQTQSSDAAAEISSTRHVVTGNRLRDGVPVYFTADGGWSPVITEAQHVAAEAAETLLAAAQACPPPHPVVAPYLIEATLGKGALRPVSLREQIRAYGPTVGSSKA